MAHPGDKLTDQPPPGGVKLGAFQLLEPLATGAMARVWRGVHRRSGLPVAVKVMTGEVARAPAYALAFRNEAEAVARLRHQAIVPVYDFGDVSVSTARQSDGAVEAGVPYLVMELAAEGSLDRGHVPSHWQALKSLLLALLGGLGHAHARGVIHRDLKPGNVLVTRDGCGARRFKLADFGLAHARRDDAVGVQHASWAASGTPSFMAPEQFKGEWRDQGPWTDLYALGCLAYALVTGRPPFQYDELQQLAHAHLREAPPRLQTDYEVAHGFEGWVSVLLAKTPEDRFLRAADARWALLELQDGHLAAYSEGEAAPPSITLAPDATPSGTVALPEEVVASASESGTMEMPDDVVWTASQTGPTQLSEPMEFEAGPVVRQAVSPTLVERRAPPLPTDWRRQEDAERGPAVGAGLGIFGLRTIPLVDRDAERDSIWTALRQVDRDGCPRAIVVRGPAGVGKSRLVRWIAERADEVGGATILRAFHSARGGPADGVVPMLARHLRCDEASRELALTRLRALVRELGDGDDLLVDAFAELLVPRAAESGTHLMEQIKAKADERHRVLVRLTRLLTLERPVIMLLDDVQWGVDALRFASMLLSEATEDTPVLLLLALRDEALHGQVLAERELERLVAHPRVRSMALGRLSPSDHLQLVEQLLGLSGELVQRVARRTDGNPLFAVQLVGDWVTRGLLVPTDVGLQLDEASGNELPDDIHGLCAARIAQAMGTRSADDQQALELAALLGEVHDAEWQLACEVAGLTPNPTLLEGMAREGLLELGVSGWRFTHGMLVESLERQARSRGRWQGHHQTIVTVLRRLYPMRTPNVAARLGRHLVAADALHDALPHLLEAARTLRVEGDYDQAMVMLGERSGVLDRLGVSAVDPRRAEGELLATLVHLDRAAFDDAERIAIRVHHHAHTEGWPSLEARAALRLGRVALARGDYDRALSLLEGALRTLHDYGDRQGVYEARSGLAEVYYYQGPREQAAQAYLDNLALAAELGDQLAVAEAHWGLGYVAMWQGEMEGAQEHFEAMRQILAHRGAVVRLADCYNALGELARLDQRFQEAEQYYRESLRINEANGTLGTLVNRLNICLAQLARGDIAPVVEALPSLLARAEQGGRHQDMAIALALAMALDASSDRWDRWDVQVAQVSQLLRETGFKDGDVAMLLGRAGAEAAARVGVRARPVLELARAQWLALGRPDRAGDIELALAELEG